MSAISLILIGSVVCLGSAGKQDLRRPMPNGRPLATQVDQAAMGQNRYAPYYVEGEKPLRKERAALWPFGPDYDEHDHHHDDHDFHDHHHDDHDFHDHHHDSHDHYDAHEHHHDQYEHGYEHGHEHGHGRGISEGFREGVFAGRPIGPNWG